MTDPTDSVTAQLPHATRMQFASDTRVYSAVLDQDLLGDWTVAQSWAGKESRRGGGKVTHVANFDEGLQLLRQIAMRRERHGYRWQIRST